MGVAADSRFRDLLEPVLPKDLEFTLWHVESHPKKCRRLIFTSKNDQTLNLLTTHLFILEHAGTAVLALEALVYEAPQVSTLFISKADTSGWYRGPRFSSRDVAQGLIRGILRYHVAPAKPVVRICLFAKTFPEYLFLGSQHNSTKHVLSDGELVRWWIRCLDGLHGEFSAIAKANLLIPGSQSAQGYLPTPGNMPWSIGDIFWDGESPDADTEWAVRRIPRFPDDPKARFLDAIVSEKRAKSVGRRQFWTELASRQEFLLGKSVGIIGIEGTLKPELHTELDGTHSVSSKDLAQFKEALLDLDFGTEESARSAMQNLQDRVPECGVISLQGQCVSPTGPKSVTEPPKRINLLGDGLVRKKQKT